MQMFFLGRVLRQRAGEGEMEKERGGKERWGRRDGEGERGKERRGN